MAKSDYTIKKRLGKALRKVRRLIKKLVDNPADLHKLNKRIKRVLKKNQVPSVLCSECIVQDTVPCANQNKCPGCFDYDGTYNPQPNQMAHMQSEVGRDGCLKDMTEDELANQFF